jgi:hypothetical protein
MMKERDREMMGEGERERDGERERERKRKRDRSAKKEDRIYTVYLGNTTVRDRNNEV